MNRLFKMRLLLSLCIGLSLLTGMPTVQAENTSKTNKSNNGRSAAPAARTAGKESPAPNKKTGNKVTTKATTKPAAQSTNKAKGKAGPQASAKSSAKSSSKSSTKNTAKNKVAKPAPEVELPPADPVPLQPAVSGPQRPSPVAPARNYAVSSEQIYLGGRKITIEGMREAGLGTSGSEHATACLQTLLDSGDVTVEPTGTDEAGTLKAKVRINGRDVVDLMRQRLRER